VGAACAPCFDPSKPCRPPCARLYLKPAPPPKRAPALSPSPPKKPPPQADRVRLRPPDH
jgi:hypothetical protein